MCSVAGLFLWRGVVISCGLCCVNCSVILCGPGAVSSSDAYVMVCSSYRRDWMMAL